MAIGYYGGSGFVIILEDFRSGKILIHDGKLMSEGVGSAGIKGLFEPIKNLRISVHYQGSRFHNAF